MLTTCHLAAYITLIQLLSWSAYFCKAMIIYFSNVLIIRCNTPVTQYGHLAVICKIGQITTDHCWVIVRSHRMLWEHCTSYEGLQGCRGHCQVLNMLKTSAVRSPWKQVAITLQLMRRWVAAGMPRVPCHHSDVAQGTRSIAVGLLLGYV